jgi:MFS family permease
LSPPDRSELTDESISKAKIWQVIGASAVGTMIEWYDFYIFGSLAATIAPLFYPPENQTFAYIAYLATFAVGFIVRPFGALFFGRIGDLVGRKYAFLVTLLIMGGATAVIGFLPTYAQIGIAAPIILLLIRVLQGLALGGEYGGAAVYVAEHVPDERRGFYTSFIQITATLGLFLSLAVILIVQNLMSPDQFAGRSEGIAGWRIPFLISIFLVAISLYIRLRMKESPIFQHVKSSGMTSASPLVEAFTHWKNLKRVLISLFGATAGQGVVWYTGQFYALFYLQSILNVNTTSANYIIAIALLLGMPFFVVFGALSDRIGRKWIILAGCLLAVVTYLPIYKAMQHAAGSNVVTASSQKNPVTGAISLTPQSIDETGSLVPAAKVLPYTTFADLISSRTAWMLIFLVPDPADLHPGDLGDDGLRADRCVSCRGVPGEDTVHSALTSVSHRQWRLRRAAAPDRTVGYRSDREYIRWTLLSDDHRGDDIRIRCDIFAGNARAQDLG